MRALSKNMKMKMSFFVVVSTILCLLIPVSVSELAIDGKVLELDDSNFETAISTFDYILVDFHAPWCGHCKRLAPQLDAAAPKLAELKEPIVIGKLNADKYTRTARKYDIDGYPTLMLFMHGVHTEYYGPREADLLVRFLKKFVAPNVTVLNSDSAIHEFVEAAGTYFPLYIGFGLDESVISNIAIKYKKKAWFSVAKDFSEDVMSSYGFDKVPALVYVHPEYNERSVFYGPFEENFIEEFVKQNLVPLVLPINEETVKLLRDDKRKVVLTIVDDETDEKTEKFTKLLKAAASANRDLVFGYVGVQQWEEFTDSFEVYRKSTKLPKMIVWDGKREYFSVVGSETIDGEDQGSQITRFLEGYRQGDTIQKSLSGPSFMGFLNSLVGGKMLYVIGLAVAIIMLIQFITKEEPLRVGSDMSARADNAGSSGSEPGADEYGPGHKED